MNHKWLIFLGLFLLTVGCSDDDLSMLQSTTECAEADIIDLPWLQELIDNCSTPNTPCVNVFYRAIFEGETVFYVRLIGLAPSNPCDNLFEVALRNCDGEIIKEYNGINEGFSTEVSDSEIIHTCED